MRGLSRLKTPPLLACLAISFFPGCGSKTGAKSKSEEIEVSAPKLAMGAEVDDIAGWNGVPWGTSRDQAKSILGTRYSKIKSVAGNEELAIEDFRIDPGTRLDISIGRDRNKGRNRCASSPSLPPPRDRQPRASDHPLITVSACAKGVEKLRPPL
jgi:hypothetical protein